MNRVNRQKELDRILASLPEGGEALSGVAAQVRAAWEQVQAAEADNAEAAVGAFSSAMGQAASALTPVSESLGQTTGQLQAKAEELTGQIATIDAALGELDAGIAQTQAALDAVDAQIAALEQGETGEPELWQHPAFAAALKRLEESL